MRSGPAILAALILGLAATSDAHAGPRIIDQGSSLFETTVAELEAELEQSYRATGVETYIVIVPSLRGQTAREAARALPLWDKPGEKVVLFLDLAGRQVRIEASEAITAEFDDATWARLIEREMLPSLRAGRKAEAVRRGVEAIDARLAGEPPRFTGFAQRGETRPLRDLLFVLSAGLLAAISFNRAARERVAAGRW